MKLLDDLTGKTAEIERNKARERAVMYEKKLAELTKTLEAERKQRQKPEPKPEPLQDVKMLIGKQELTTIANAFETRMTGFERRMCKLEGGYGDIISQLKMEIKDKEDELMEAEEEIEKLEEANKQFHDIAAKREQMKQNLPAALETIGYDDKQQGMIMQVVQSRQAEETVNNLIEEHFPETPIDYKGLVSIAPVIIALVGSLAQHGIKIGAPKNAEEEKAQAAPPMQATF